MRTPILAVEFGGLSPDRAGDATGTSNGSPSAETHELFEPLVSRHPWFAALLLATVATPAGVVFAWLAPRPLDAVVALPLVLLDVWAESAGATATAEIPSNEAPTVRVMLLVVGIVLTWLLYVLIARLVLWRLLLRDGNGSSRDSEP